MDWVLIALLGGVNWQLRQHGYTDELALFHKRRWWWKVYTLCDLRGKVWMYEARYDVIYGYLCGLLHRLENGEADGRTDNVL